MTENTPSNSVLMFGSVDVDVCNACTLHLSGVANAFHSLGLHVILVVPKSSISVSELDKMLLDGVELREFSKPSIPAFGKTVWTLGPIFSFLKFARLLKNERIDFVYIRSGLLTFLLQILCRVWSVNSVSEHNGFIREELELTSIMDKTFGWVFSQLQNLDCYLSSKVRVVTPWMIDRFAKMGIATEKIFYCGNASNLTENDIVMRNKALDYFKLDHAKIYVGFLGSLRRWQGVHHLVDAFNLALKSEPNLRLLIGGDGPIKLELEQKVAQCEISHAVHFLGQISYDARVFFLSSLDIATLPATKERNMKLGVSPLKIRDYLAMERMILASNVPGLEEMEKAGALVLHEPGNEKVMAELMEYFAGQAELRKEISQTGAKYAKENFSWKKVASKICSSVQG